MEEFERVSAVSERPEKRPKMADNDGDDDFIEVLEHEGSDEERGARTAAPVLNESVNLISYTCVQCQSKFNSIQDLRDHTWTEHEKRLLELKKHTKAVHIGAPEKSGDADGDEVSKLD